MVREEEPAKKATRWTPRSLSQALAAQGIRINGVARGLISTPLIPSRFPAKDVAEFAKRTKARLKVELKQTKRSVNNS